MTESDDISDAPDGEENGGIKGRQVYNGKPTRDWVSKEDKVLSTVANEALVLTSMIDSIEDRDVMSSDIKNAFIQANLNRKDDEERVIMKITGKLVEWLVELSPETDQKYVVVEKGENVLYVEVL